MKDKQVNEDTERGEGGFGSTGKCGADMGMFEQVLERMTSGMGRDCSVECQLLESDVVEYADRILTAHNREMAEKDEEIDRWRKQALEEDAAANALQEENTKLRALVGELADALGSEARVKCALCDTRRRFKGCHEIKGFCSVYDINTLVAKAREVVK